MHDGVIGEVKTPIVKGEDWEDYENVHIPYAMLEFNVEEVNKKIATEYKDKFVLSELVARPFERLQFIRGTENLFVDLMTEPENLFKFINKMQDFYLQMIEKWCKTNIDRIFFMDDWGSQNSLLINPVVWEKVFQPLYKQYRDRAHKYGKKAFMHSNGYTLSIIPKLIDIKLTAFNCQIFCMGTKKLMKFKGKITFWGEIDRQHLIPYGTIKDIDDAVD